MIIITGGAGFIGSNLVKALNSRERSDILVVDDLTDGTKYRNLMECEISDYWDKGELLAHMTAGREFDDSVDAVLHQGACTVTTEWNGRYMMENNYGYSKLLLEYCTDRAIPFLYASSAAIYGDGGVFREAREFEAPLNVYGYSKLLFDRYVLGRLSRSRSQIAGFRYFNVYGPREAHKQSMASVAYHFRNQLLNDGKVRLFEGTAGYANGEQRRDFVHVDDVVALILWFLEHPHVSGIFNVGTGLSQSFNDVAHAIIAWYKRGEIEYIPFPEELSGRYQSFTQADVAALRGTGYEASFLPVEEGVPRYMAWLDAQDGRP